MRNKVQYSLGLLCKNHMFKFKCISLFLLLISFAPSANAYVFVDDDQVRVQVTTWARAGWQLNINDAGTVEEKPVLDLARLLLDVRYKPWGRAFVNIAGKSLSLRLLDAFGEVNLGDHVRVRVGRDRVNISRSFLVGAPFIAFNRRSLINQEGWINTRANGAGVRFHGDLFQGHLALDLNAIVRDDLIPGTTFVARALFTREGLEVHAAYQEHFHNTVDTLLDQNRLLDLAVFYSARGYTFRTEVITALKSQARDLPWAFHSEFLKSFDVNLLDRSFSVEPGFRYDASQKDNVTFVQRATLGLNVYFLSHRLKMQFNADVQLRNAEVEQIYTAQLQGGM